MENRENGSARRRVAILCGGQSGEHEISLLSARSILDAMDRDKYDVTVVGIGKDGQWRLQNDPDFLQKQNDPRTIHLDASGPRVRLPADPQTGGFLVCDEAGSTASILPIDVVFPVLHGPYGEDGTVQGLFELANVAYVGAGVVGSAVGMDKDVMKRLLRDAKIPTPAFMVIYQRHWARDPRGCQRAIWEQLQPPVFVKPANLGSSVGVSKVKTVGDLPAALELAFRYDMKAIVEQFIKGREIECSVLGNDDPIASMPGEIVPRHEFYSYEAKYLDAEGAELKIPTDLPEKVDERVRRLAVAVYRTLCCEGMARIDFFLADDGRLLVSEINTIPGFTRISMYPKLWDTSGVSFAELIDRLIELALERHTRRRRLHIDHP